MVKKKFFYSEFSVSENLILNFYYYFLLIKAATAGVTKRLSIFICFCFILIN